MRPNSIQNGPAAAGHDIVVVGASAGGIGAVRVARRLPPDLPAVVFAVVHMPHGPSSLPQIERTSPSASSSS